MSKIIMRRRQRWEMNVLLVQKEAPVSAEVLLFSAFLAPDALPGELLLKGAACVWLELMLFVMTGGQKQTAANKFLHNAGSRLIGMDRYLAGSAGIIMQQKINWTTFDKLLEPLARCTLAQVNQDNHTYTLAPLTQQILRERLTPKQQQEQIERVVKALLQIHPGWDAAAEPLGRLMLPHWRVSTAFIEQYAPQMPQAGFLFAYTAQYLAERKHYAEAEPLYHKALAVFSETLPQGTPSIGSCLVALAQMYKDQGRYEEAEPFLKGVLEIKRVKRPGSVTLAKSIEDLGGLYKEQGRYKEAEALYREAVEILKDEYPASHPTMVDLRDTLAELSAGKAKDKELPEREAEFPQEEQTMLCQAPNEKGTPAYAAELNNRGVAYRNTGQGGAAEPLYKEALALQRALLPPNDPATATTLNNLGTLYNTQSRYEEAEPLLNEALAIRRKALRPGDKRINLSFSELENLYRTLGHKDKLNRLYEEAQAD